MKGRPQDFKNWLLDFLHSKFPKNLTEFYQSSSSNLEKRTTKTRKQYQNFQVNCTWNKMWKFKRLMEVEDCRISLHSASTVSGVSWNNKDLLNYVNRLVFLSSDCRIKKVRSAAQFLWSSSRNVCNSLHILDRHQRTPRAAIGRYGTLSPGLAWHTWQHILRSKYTFPKVHTYVWLPVRQFANLVMQFSSRKLRASSLQEKSWIEKLDERRSEREREREK